MTKRKITLTDVGIVTVVTFVILALTLLVEVCIPSIKGQSAASLTLREWVDSGTFIPVILWPEPEGSHLWFPPRYINKPGYIELLYAESTAEKGMEASMYMLYESNSALPVGKQILTDYDAADTEVIITSANATLCGKAIRLEIRENSSKPESGVAIFELDGTHVAYHWQHIPRVTALRVLDRNLVQVQKNDSDIISSFDRMLANRFRTLDFSPTFGP